jgi:hypothetical protein
MTALVFWNSAETVVVAMDTLAMTADTRQPYFYMSKAFPLPHLEMLMCGTGVGDLSKDWYFRLQKFLAYDIVCLDQFVQSSLLELASKYNLNADLTATIYHFGYSLTERCYVGYAYRSTNQFRSERLPYGLATKPPIQDPKLGQFPDDFIELVKRQRFEDEQLPEAERIFIGGEIQTYILQNRSINIQTVYRFDDYQDTYQAMLSNL